MLTGQVEQIVRAKGPGIKVLGMKIGCTLTYGAKLFLPKAEQSTGLFPEIQFVLLDTKIEPQGPGSWVLRRMDKAGSKHLKISSITKVTIEETDDHKLAFKSHAILHANMHLPAWAVRILPFSRARIQDAGSRSMQESLERNIGPRLNRFQAAFLQI